MENYPKWLYHAKKEPVIVQSAEEQKSLGKGWEEAPIEKELKVKNDTQVSEESKPVKEDE